MNGFKKCDNGHFYKEDLSACPYCPVEQELLIMQVEMI
jgi:hypothetical protein